MDVTLVKEASLPINGVKCDMLICVNCMVGNVLNVELVLCPVTWACGRLVLDPCIINVIKIYTQYDFRIFHETLCSLLPIAGDRNYIIISDNFTSVYIYEISYGFVYIFNISQ